MVKGIYFNVYALAVHADTECKGENLANNIPTKVPAIRIAASLMLYDSVAKQTTYA